MKHSLISVVVPIFNMEKYLDKCIESIVEQSFPNIEILLVDDGSTDNSPKICDDWAKKDKRIKVFHKKNGGLSDAKNYGIDHASGEYISFVDADDWVDFDMFEKTYKEISENNVDIIIFGRYLEFGNHSYEQKVPEKKIMDAREAIIKMNTFQGFDMASWDKIYRKSLFDGVRFPYGKKCEDAYTTYVLFSKCNRIECYPKCFYHYLQRGDSISKRSVLNKDLIYASLEQRDFIAKNYNDIKEIGEIGYSFAVKSMYEIAIERKIAIDDELKKFKKDIRKSGRIIRRNPYLSRKKKIAFSLFNDYYLLYVTLKKIKCSIRKEKLNG